MPFRRPELSTSRLVWAAGLFVLLFALYTLTNYGGVRSPDAEIVFRVAESIARDASVDVRREITSYEGHGVARGKNGKLYAVYGPGESFLLAPLVRVADLINRSRWYADPAARVPVSHYSGVGILEFLRGTRPVDLEPHAVRYLVSYFNPVVGAAVAVAFFWLLCLFVDSTPAAALTALLYGVGTLAWPYSATFFAEQPTTLFLVSSLACAVSVDPRLRNGPSTRSGPALAAAGALLGLACATHVLAGTFAPFLALYVVLIVAASRDTTRSRLALLAWFAAGLGLVLLLVGVFNLVRFGGLLETGRTLDSAQSRVYGIVSFRLRWRGLFDLLFSGGKGLVFFCPAVLLGVATWGGLHRRYASFAAILAAALVFRVLLISGLDIWHGGFALGPRYLVMALPFALLPVGLWVERALASERPTRYAIFGATLAICAVQQLYFSLADVFTFYHLVKWRFAESGVSIFADDEIYRSWKLTPLTHLHHSPRSPFMLQSVPLGNVALWGIASAVLVAALIALLCFAWRYGRRETQATRP